MKRILIVEDDKVLSELLEERLKEEGYAIISAMTIKEAKEKLVENIDLGIIDVGLPDGSGFALAREIFETQHIPFVFLTAMNSAEYRLEGYELGALDYIPKPFHLRELLLRIKRIIGSNQEGEVISLNGIDINRATRQVIKDGISLDLQGKDFDLLLYIVQHRPRVVSRKEIQEKLFNNDVHPRTIDNMIVRLRHTVGDEQLLSVRGIGYRWSV